MATLAAAPAGVDVEERPRASMFTYRLAYPGVHAPATRCFQRRGMRPSLPKDPRCVFEFAQRSRATFQRAHGHTCVTNNIFVHRGLADKARLACVLSAMPADAAPPFPAPSFVGDGPVALMHAAAGDTSHRNGPWCIKAASVNNSLGLHFFPSWAALRDGLEEFCARHAEERAFVVQPYVADRLVLYHGRKCHVRLNVLVAGRQGHVFVHRTPVVHVAQAVFEPAAYEDRAVHITNHVASHTTASRVTLAHVGEDAGVDALATCAFDAMCDSVARLMRGLVGHGNEFLPTENCFELYGFDFFLQHTDEGVLRPVLLEVNSGPGLEGRVDERLCEEIIEDTLQLVLDPWHDPAAAVGKAPCPAGYRALGPFFGTPSPQRPLDVASATFLAHLEKVRRFERRLDDEDAGSESGRSAWHAIEWSHVLAVAATGARRPCAPRLFMRSALVRKDRLAVYCGAYLPRTTTVASSSALLAAVEASSSSLFVLKPAASSNAHGVVSFNRDGVHALTSRFSPPRLHVVQDYVQPWLLQQCGGRKMHFRALVLCAGECNVYLHEEVRVLCATRPWTRDKLDDALVHVTNASANPDGTNLSLAELHDDEGKPVKERVWSQMSDICRGVFQSLEKAPRREFLRLTNTFEVFGFDFLAAGVGNGKVVLLEANPEPSRTLFPDPIVVGPDCLDGPGAPSLTHFRQII
jgi:hypothetical protein